MANKCEYVKVMTPRFRLSFPHLAEPFAGPDGKDPRYSIKMLFPEDEYNEAERAQMKEIRDTCKKVALQFFNGKLPANLKKPLRNGNETEYAEDDGMTIASARTKNKPGIVDGKLRDITSKEEIEEKLYAGCWCRATIAIGATDTAGNKCVHFILNNVQKLKDDKKFGNRVAAREEFEEVDGYTEACEGEFSDSESDFADDEF